MLCAYPIFGHNTSHQWSLRGYDLSDISYSWSLPRRVSNVCISSKFISCASYRNSHYENNQDKKKRPNFTLSYAIHLTTSSDKRYKIYLPQKEHSFRASVPVSEGMPQISRIKVKTYLNLSLGKRHQCCWLEPSSNSPRNDPKHFDFPSP